MPAPPPESEVAIVTAVTQRRRSFFISRRERIAPLQSEETRNAFLTIRIGPSGAAASPCRVAARGGRYPFSLRRREVEKRLRGRDFARRLTDRLHALGSPAHTRGRGRRGLGGTSHGRPGRGLAAVRHRRR